MAVGLIDMNVNCDSEIAYIYRGVTVFIVRVTPAIAAEWMKRNENNRPLSKQHVDHLKTVLTAGDFILNGETIIFSVDGRLLNGQHRLQACISSGVSFDTLVVRGIDNKSFSTLDGGRSRRTSEVLQMTGETNATKLSAAAQAIVSFIDTRGRVTTSGGCGRKLTAMLAARVLEAHPGLRSSVSAMQSNTMYANQQGYALHYLFSRVSQQLANDFADVLSSGSGDLGRPFNILREGMIRTPVRTELRRSYAAKAIKAFNAERSGARPKMFKFVDGEEFPIIDGLDYEAFCESV